MAILPPDLVQRTPLRTIARVIRVLSPFALKIGLKVAAESAASFEPMYV
jgi:hypothetical protein